MPAFQKVVGGLEALLRAQAELAGHPAAALAKDLYVGQMPEGLVLKHGTPHLFAPAEGNPLGRFDFMGNLSRGEGNQSFGPGGYLTGDPGLAAEYARKLAAPGARKPTSLPPNSWLAAYQHDPEGFLEFLRGRTMNKAFGYGLNPEGGNWAQARPTELGSLGANGLWQTTTKTPEGVARVDLKNAGAYKEAMGGLGRFLERPVNTFDSPQEAADIGRMLIDAGALQEGSPRVVQQRLATLDKSKLPQNKYGQPEWAAVNAERLRLAAELGLGQQVASSHVDVTRRNLNAVQEGLTPGSVPRVPTYKASMAQSVKLSNLGSHQKEWTPDPDKRPRVYTAETPATPSELFSYDHPLSTASPRVVGALAGVAEKLGLKLPQDASFADLSGKDFIEKARSRYHGDPGKVVQAMQEARIPGMYYLRAGHRTGTGPAPTFDIGAHNFVWFDDPLLNIVDRLDKCAGGTVP